MKLSATVLTDAGRVRKNNEDSCLVDEALGLVVVADGMGGHAAGEVASRLAVDVIRDQVGQGFKTGKIPSVGEMPLHWSDRARLLVAAVRVANEMIFQAARERVERAGMGTTVVAALMNGSRVAVAHVGDSRFYLFRKDRVVAVTRDHSFVAEQVARGALTPAEAETSQAGNILTRALGVGPSVDVDAFEPAVEGGDLFLLCSDGLSKMVTDEVLVGALRGAQDPARLCQDLVRLALDRGSQDNVTVAVGHLSRESVWARAASLWRRTLRRKLTSQGGAV